MLLVESRFKDFTRKELCDATKQTEAILASTRRAATRSTSSRRPRSLPALHRRTIRWTTASAMAQLPDPDGHLWEVFWMNPDAVPHEASAAGASNVS